MDKTDYRSELTDLKSKVFPRAFRLLKNLAAKQGRTRLEFTDIHPKLDAGNIHNISIQTASFSRMLFALSQLNLLHVQGPVIYIGEKMPDFSSVIKSYYIASKEASFIAVRSGVGYIEPVDHNTIFTGSLEECVTMANEMDGWTCVLDSDGRIMWENCDQNQIWHVLQGTSVSNTQY
jgi:hypothetical protein